MNYITQYPVPNWMAILFIVIIPIPAILLSLLARKGVEKQRQFKVTIVVASFFVIYYMYVSFASYAGWFMYESLPPKVLVYTTIPYAIVLFIFVFPSKKFGNLLEKIMLEDLIKIHIFRLIGVFFILLAVYDALPKTFALIAGLGDIITAVASIWVANQVKNKATNALKWVLFWNIFGLADIIITAVSANIITYISISKGTMGVDTLAFFPFSLIPAFAPPTIVFLHVCIFKKMSIQKT